MTTDFSQMNLQGLDLVYAISQQQLNGAVATALAESMPLISFAYADSGGNWVPPTQQLPAAITFSGTWAPALDSNSGQLRVPILDMSQGATPASGQVIINLTFAAGATLTDTLSDKIYIQPDPTSESTPVSAIWVVSMMVPVSLALLEESDIPLQVKNQLDILNNKFGSIFSVQQVLADLSAMIPNAKLNSSIPDNMGDLSWPMFQQALGVYLKNAEAIGNIPLASLITQNDGTPTASPPAVTPTSADFVVLPNSTTPALSALVFAMMSQGRPLPGGDDLPSLYENFSGVGFTDPNATGTLVIRAGCLAEVINDAVAASQVMSELTFHLAVGPPTSEYATFTLEQDSPVPDLQLVTPVADSYQIAAFSYQPLPPCSNGGQFGFLNADSWSGSSQVNNSMSINLAPSATSETPSLVNVAGTIVIQCNSSWGNNQEGGVVSAQLNPTTFPWSASYRLQADDTAQGQIDFNMIGSDFNTPPTTQAGTSWGDFLALISNTDLNPSLDNIRGNLSNYLSSTVKTGFVSGLSDLQSFVLPGNNVFSFSGIFVNMSCNLVASMQYRDLGSSSTARDEAVRRNRTA